MFIDGAKVFYFLHTEYSISKFSFDLNNFKEALLIRLNP